MSEALQAREALRPCEHDGDCSDESVAVLTLQTPVFRSDYVPRNLCRRHALQRMRAADRLGYSPSLESVDQLALF